ncbi:MAG TPA: ABC transporter permease [Acidimicrobiales bacterium]|nr:ABC transporter permease [Acidimicrobiales bacterium]
MTTITAEGPLTASHPHRLASHRPSLTAAWATLAGRRLSLSAHTPREVLAPLATPLLFALVLAPALAKMIPTAGASGLDYRTFVIVGTVGLLIPLACTFAGIGVIVDRTTGARREMLAAPVPRSTIVAGNLAVAAGVSLLQVGVLLGAGVLRGSRFDATATGIGWFVGAVLAFTVFMYALSEILANRISSQEEYVGLTPVVAIVPWFLAGSLFPISALPHFLAWITRVLPLTHALALLRYGLVDRHGGGLHDIWGMTNATTEAILSLGVLLVWASVVTVASVRVFNRSAVQ